MQLEAELRTRMVSMSAKARGEFIAKAIANDDELTLGSIFRGPAVLIGTSEGELDMRRAMWRAKRFPSEFDREQRLTKAVAALDRGGKALVSFIEAAANTPAATAAEQGAKRSAEAVAAAAE